MSQIRSFNAKPHPEPTPAASVRSFRCELEATGTCTRCRSARGAAAALRGVGGRPGTKEFNVQSHHSAAPVNIRLCGARLGNTCRTPGQHSSKASRARACRDFSIVVRSGPGVAGGERCAVFYARAAAKPGNAVGSSGYYNQVPDCNTSHARIRRSASWRPGLIFVAH